MTITVNGEPMALRDGATLTTLVELLGCGTKGVAVAVNETVVPRSTWAHTTVHSDDRVEVLRAAQGG